MDKKTRSDIDKYYETLAPNAKMENVRNLSICTIYFKDLMASIRHRFGDISKFEELDYLSKRDIDEVLNKVLDEFIPVHIFSQTRDTLKKGVNPALYSFEWNSNLVNIFQIKERKSECRVVKFPNGFPSFSRIALTSSGRVFLTGGFVKDENMYLRTTYEYIEKENKMQRKANMIFRRSDHSLVYTRHKVNNKGYIYAVGAFVDGKFTDSVERYVIDEEKVGKGKLKEDEKKEEEDKEGDKWEIMDSMHTQRSGVGL